MRRLWYTHKNTLWKLLATLLALGLWQAVALAIGEELILVTPVKVFLRLFTIWQTEGFFSALLLSFLRITLGFILAFLIGIILAVLAGKLHVIEILLSPYMTAVKAVPVASFIVLAYVWFSASSLSAFIAFLIVLPTVYSHLLSAIKSMPKEMKEMLFAFDVPFSKRLFTVFLPYLRPFVLSACALGTGLAWKSGVAAEIITMPSDSIGNLIYYANLWLQSVDLYAYTVLLVLLSILSQLLFSLILRLLFDLLEHIPTHLVIKDKVPASLKGDITLSHLQKVYEGEVVLADLSLTIPYGKTVCLMAPSGRGKTTLMRILAGLEAADAGNISYQGPVAFVFQEDLLSLRLNAVQNAMLGRRGATAEEATLLLTELGLGEHLKKPASALSGGMRRRVAIARALLSQAPLLLLDEALKGLDEATKERVAAVIRARAANKTVLAVTHDEEDARLLGGSIQRL